MLDADPRSLVAAAALAVAAVFVYFNRRKVLDANLALFADLTHGRVEFPLVGFPFYALVVGRYQGRLVTGTFNLITRRFDFSLYIEPMTVTSDSALLRSLDDEPTEYTLMQGRKIYYWGPSGVSLGTERNRRPYLPSLISGLIKREDALFFLDQLLQAAVVVETGRVAEPQSTPVTK